MPSATLQQIADVAGCSRSVVSCVLNKSKSNVRVSEELRKKIIIAAEHLNYRPNFAARSLVRQATRTLGVYVSPHPFGSLAQQYEGGIFRGVEAACRQNRFSLLMLNFSGGESPEFCMEQIQEQRIDGLILFQTQPFSDWEHQLIDQIGSVAIVGPEYPGRPIPTVDFDNAAGIELAVSHLVELGHRKIGFIGSLLDQPSAHALERATAFKSALTRRGLSLAPEWIFTRDQITDGIKPEHNYCMAEGYIGAAHMFKLPADIRPTAILAYNDQVASGVYRYAHEHSLRLPATFSVIGIDNENFCDVLTPRLTSIGLPLEQMGQMITSYLIEQLHRASSMPSTHAEKPKRTLVQPKLVCRESTQRIHGS